MSEARDASVIAESRRQAERLSKLGWYHSIELPDGSVIEGHQTVEQLRRRLAKFPIPQDLSGKRVLDIGAWDGWFSFEMERRGAQVTALDSTRSTRFLEAKKLLGSKVEYRIGDICRMTWRELGRFDIVLFLGVLYHVKHPLLALENVCGMCEEMACIESFVSDSEPGAIASMEFYETTELRGQLDNWVGPNAACLLAFIRTAGFARVQDEGALGERGHVTAWRKWDLPQGTLAAPAVQCVENSATRDLQFSAQADDYVTFYFTAVESALTCDTVHPEIGGYGVRPLYVTPVGDGWQASAKLPPGLDAGSYPARLRTAMSEFSEPLQLVIDAAWKPGVVDRALRITRIADGKAFVDGQVVVAEGSALSVWAEGLPVNVALSAVKLRLNGSDLPAIWIGGQQINALLPSGLEAGMVQVSVVVGERESAPVSLEICRSF